MTLHLQLIGIALMTLALVHLAFPRHFRWPEELARVSLLTRQIFYVHTFFICLVLFLVGLLCLTHAPDLIQNTPVNRALHLGLAAFWFIRLFTQLFVYDRSHWRGKPFETAMHLLFTLFWIYLAAVHALVLRQI
jgi:hypothetical protein